MHRLIVFLTLYSTNFRWNRGVTYVSHLLHGVVRIKVNVRTDQDYQRKVAGLPEDSEILLVDCPGGAVGPQDTLGLHKALARKIAEETGGCVATQMGEFSTPLDYMNKNPDQPSDLALWKPVVLHEDPKPSNEALDHPCQGKILNRAKTIPPGFRVGP